MFQTSLTAVRSDTESQTDRQGLGWTARTAPRTPRRPEQDDQEATQVQRASQGLARGKGPHGESAPPLPVTFRVDGIPAGTGTSFIVSFVCLSKASQAGILESGRPCAHLPQALMVMTKDATPKAGTVHLRSQVQNLGDRSPGRAAFHTPRQKVEYSTMRRHVLGHFAIRVSRISLHGLRRFSHLAAPFPSLWAPLGAGQSGGVWVEPSFAP